MSKITVLGVDTAKHVFELCGVDGRGQIILRKTVKRGQFLATIAKLAKCRVVLEACGASHHWGRCLQALGHEVRLIAPQLVKAYRRGQKNDYRDAEAIVSAALAPGIHYVGIKGVTQQAEQALHRVRTRLQRQRTAAGNALRGVLTEYGVVFGRGLPTLRRGAGAWALSEQAQALGLQVMVADILVEIDQLGQRIDHYQREIEHRVRSNGRAQALMDELAGVGPLSASALSVKVADPRLFANGRNFSAFLGFAPCQRSSGGKVRLGKLSKGGDRYLRQLLIHGARAVLQHLGDKQDPTSRWLRALTARRGFNIACVALAHKNARQAWAILARAPD